MNSEQAMTELYEAITNLMPDLMPGALLEIGDVLNLTNEPFYIKIWLDERVGNYISVYNPGRIFTDAIGVMGKLEIIDDRYKIVSSKMNYDEINVMQYIGLVFSFDDIKEIRLNNTHGSELILKGDKLDDAYSPDS